MRLGGDDAVFLLERGVEAVVDIRNGKLRINVRIQIAGKQHNRLALGGNQTFDAHDIVFLGQLKELLQKGRGRFSGQLENAGFRMGAHPADVLGEGRQFGKRAGNAPLADKRALALKAVERALVDQIGDGLFGRSAADAEGGGNLGFAGHFFIGIFFRSHFTQIVFDDDVLRNMLLVFVHRMKLPFIGIHVSSTHNIIGKR